MLYYHRTLLQELQQLQPLYQTQKLQDMLLLGYSPSEVARPYINMVLAINAVVLVVAIVLMLLARAYYLPMLQAMGTPGGTIVIALVVAVIIMALISVGNIIAIRRKINALWIQQS